MTNEIELHSFGTYLKTLRSEKGISLSHVSKETGIREYILENIEEENHDKLPEKVYVQNFIRIYANFLNGDAEKAVKYYQDVAPETPMSTVVLMPEKKRGPIDWEYWIKFVVISVLVIAVLIALVFGVFFLIDRPKTEPAVNSPSVESPPLVQPRPPIMSEETSDPDLASPAGKSDENPPNLLENEEMAREENPEPPPFAETDVPEEEVFVEESLPEEATPASADTEESLPAEKPKTYTLAVKCIDTTWLRVTIDGNRVKEYMLKPEEEISLEADESFNLHIGNAGGIQILLNNKPVTIPDAPGKVVRMELPKKD